MSCFPILYNPVSFAASPPPLATLPKVDTNCTGPSLIPTVNGNTVLSFSTHGQHSAAKGSSTTVSRSDIRLIQHLDSSAWFGPGVALNWLFPYPLITPQSRRPTRRPLSGGVLDSSIIQGPFSVAPSQTLITRFATFTSLYLTARPR